MLSNLLCYLRLTSLRSTTYTNTPVLLCVLAFATALSLCLDPPPEGGTQVNPGVGTPLHTPTLSSLTSVWGRYGEDIGWDRDRGLEKFWEVVLDWLVSGRSPWFQKTTPPWWGFRGLLVGQPLAVAL